MLLKFSKHLQLSIWSSSTRINCQLLPLILVVSAFEVSLATVSSAVAKSSASTSFCSEHLSSLAFSQSIPIYLGWNSIILVICFHIFCCIDHVFVVSVNYFLIFSIFSFLSCLFHKLLWLMFSPLFHESSWFILFVCDELDIKRLSLIDLTNNRLLLPALETTLDMNWLSGHNCD